MFTKKLTFLNDYSLKKNILKQPFFLNSQKPNTLFTLKNTDPISPLKKNLNFLRKKSISLKSKDFFYQNTNHLVNDYTSEDVQNINSQKKLPQNLSFQNKITQQSGLQKLTLHLKTKKNVSSQTLNTIKLKKVNISKVTPLIQFVVNKIKRSYLQQVKYKQSKFLKVFKGPRPRIFSKQQKRNFALVFYLGKLLNKKSRYLRFVYLKRFFK